MNQPDLPKLIVRARKIANVRAGETWVYPNAVVEGPEHATFVQVLTETDQHVGWADYNPVAPVRARILSRDSAWPGDDAWVGLALQNSINRRLRLHYHLQAGGIRLVNGEGDGLPGLVVDAYGAYLSIDIYSAGMLSRLPAIKRSLQSMLADYKQIVRFGADSAKREGADPIEPEEATLRFNENGIAFQFDVNSSQKSGFFLDQRDNRRLIMQIAPQRRMLDLFCYHGGFGLHALAGGASEAWFVDSSQKAIDATKANLERNDLGGMLVCEDVFKFLDNLGEDEKFDLIVCDPPKLAPAKKDRKRALSAYRVLISRCVRHLNPGGVLQVASCSQAIGSEDMLRLLKQLGKKAGITFDVLAITGQPTDHPWPVAFETGRYLSAVTVEMRS